jgi:periodic tryptophan protein 1
VGTFNPGIEIWNMDVLNALEPSCVLGGEDTSVADDLMRLQILNAARGRSVSEIEQSVPIGRGGFRPGSHTDAVIALSWNQVHKQVIASGSADKTVKLWDVTQGTNASTFSHHRDKVQSVAWNPKEGTLLATASYDRTMTLVDGRSSGDASNVKSVKISADSEAIAWDPFHPERLTVVTDDGTISCWDVRPFQTSTPLWSFVASEFGGISDISYNAQVPGLMVTCSVDKSVTLWDASCTQSTTDKSQSLLPPKSCGSKDMCSGKLYTIDFYPSSAWLLGCGGSGNLLALWDLSRESTIQNRFRPRMENSEGVLAESPTEKVAINEDFDMMMKEKVDKPVPHTSKTSKQSDDRKNKKGKAKGKAHRKS